jgi:hypothetical protein
MIRIHAVHFFLEVMTSYSLSSSTDWMTIFGMTRLPDIYGFIEEIHSLLLLENKGRTAGGLDGLLLIICVFWRLLMKLSNCMICDYIL